MALKILISSLFLSFISLIALGWKWEIAKKITIPSALFIGILAGAIAYGISILWSSSFYKILVINIFLIAGISISLLLWRFYRDPERIDNIDDNTILSPADGRILYVKKIEKGEIPFSEKNGSKFHLSDFVHCNLLSEGGYIIGISMNYLDVHVNRAPIGGKIIFLKYIKGIFMSLKRMEAVLQNERVLTVIDNGHFRVGIVQIASRLVRKIITYFKEGQEITKGERMGAIRFGSQVDLILPDLPSITISVKPEENVKACISVIASIKSE